MNITRPSSASTPGPAVGEHGIASMSATLTPVPSPARTDRHPFPARMVGTNLALLLCGFGLQLLFFDHGGHGTLSDLPHVYLHRGIGPDAIPYLQKALEYPVGSGIMLWLASLISSTPLGVFTVTAVVAAGLCFAITVALERRFGTRAWRWVLGTPLLLFAFQNWDVFAIAAMLVGIFAFERNRDRVAGAALGLGAAVKLFPAILIPPLAAKRWVQGDRQGARRLVLMGAGVFLALNLPFAIANSSLWWWTFAFQSRRGATWGSGSYWVYEAIGAPVHGAAAAQLANLVSFGALTAGLAWLVLVTVRRNLSVMAIAAAGVGIFVLANKVWSPTYDVWLLAFFVVLPTLSRRLWISFCAVDLAIYVVVYGYFHGLESLAIGSTAMPLLVAIRIAIVLRLVFVATRPQGTRAIEPAEHLDLIRAA